MPGQYCGLREFAHLQSMSPAFSSIDERNEFVLSHGEFARKIAVRFVGAAKRVRADLDDVLQDAWLGLLLASETWNPDAWPESQHEEFLRIWVAATIRKGLSIAGPSPDCHRLGISSNGLFGAVAQLPENSRFRVRATRVVSNRLMWMVVTDKPEQRRKRKQTTEV
jgi:hypothetical protein